MITCTVYPKKYAHGFVVLCFVVVMQSFIMNSHEVFIHIHQGCFAGTGAIVRLPQCQWSKPYGYGKISQCITTTKHSKAKTVCIFLGIYCMTTQCSTTDETLKCILFFSLHVLRIQFHKRPVHPLIGGVVVKSVINGFKWSIYPYSTGSFHWHAGNIVSWCQKTPKAMGKPIGRYTRNNRKWTVWVTVEGSWYIYIFQFHGISVAVPVVYVISQRCSKNWPCCSIRKTEMTSFVV